MFNLIVFGMLMPCLILQAPKDDKPVKSLESLAQLVPETMLGKPVVVRIGSSSPDAVAKTLSQVYPRLLVSLVRDTSILVIRGPENETKDAAALVKEMTGDGAIPESATVKLINIVSGKPQEIVSQLMPIFGRTGLSIAADESRSTLLVRGDADTVQQVEALIKQIDRAPQNFTLDFTFLIASAQPVQGREPVPADLAKTAEELKRFGHLCLLGRLHSVVTDNEKFEIEGQAYHDFSATVKGRIREVAANGAIRLDLEAQVMKYRTENGNIAKVISAEKTYELRTTIQIDPNTDVAVGVAPSGSGTGETGILIVRMTK
jgi:hypothetical protein